MCDALSLPALVIDGVLKVSGKVPKVEKQNQVSIMDSQKNIHHEPDL
jgi:hypothetical protein